MFGKFISLAIFLLLYILIISGLPELILYNKINYLINLTMLFASAFLYLKIFFSINYRYRKILFVFFIIVQLHLFSSMLGDIHERSMDIYDSDDMSSLIIIPCCIIYILLWGRYFDNKSLLSNKIKH